MGDMTWVAYVIAAAILAAGAWFTFKRVPQDANRSSRPPDPPR